MEEGWLLAELEQRFGFGLEELARQFDRSVSWVLRYLLLHAVRQKLNRGQATNGRGLRAGGDEVFGAGGAWQPGRLPTDGGGFRAAQVHQPASRAAVCRWREASPQIRAHLLEQPQLFLKVQREAEPAAASSLQELLRDLEIVAAIAHRANRRLRKMHDQCEPPQEEQSEMLRHSLARGLQELQRLAT